MIKGLLKPKRLECDQNTSTDTYGRFIVEPLERGFGVTLGNLFRRVLLSSLPGAAVTRVKIKEVYHEFSTVPGVLEDVTEMILNMKQLLVKLKVESPKTLYLKAKGAKEVTAKDIMPDEDVEILNPNLHIATLNREAKLEMELMVKPGRSYVVAEMNQEEDQVVVIAKIPVGEMIGFSSDLRSATEGRGNSSLVDQMFEKLPLELQEKIRSQIIQRKGLSAGELGA